MRIAFLGSSDFAVPPLQSLIRADRAPVLVITQPDAPKKRGRAVSPSPVGVEALSAGLVLERPEDVNSPAALGKLREARPDLCVVVAYGQKLGRELLSAMPLGTVNIHASLLPRYRGAAPIQKAILEGETQTGVTLLEVVEKMDAGDVLAQRRLTIGPEETAGELHDRLARLGAELLIDMLPAISSGTLPRRAQDPAAVSWAHRLSKHDGRVGFEREPRRFVNHVRAMTPWPGAFCFVEQRASSQGASSQGSGKERLILLETRPAGEAVDALPGTVLSVDKTILVAVAGGRIEILKLMRAGKKPLDSEAFLRGFPLRVGDRLL